jgi:hypothetical protein
MVNTHAHNSMNKRMQTQHDSNTVHDYAKSNQKSQ